MSVKEKFSGYRVAAAAGVILFMNQGSMGTFGIFIRPIAEDNGYTIGATMLGISFSTAAGVLLGFIAPPLIEKLKPRGCLLVATIVCGIHFWGFAFSHSLWSFWLWSSTTSFTVVFGSNAVIGSLVGKWFLDKRAAVLGFVFGASTLGTSVWQLISGYLITWHGYRVAYLVMGAGLMAVSLVANLCFLRLPEQLGQKALGWEEAEKKKAEAEAASAEAAATAEGLAYSDARKTLAYWLLFAGLILSPMSVGGSKSNVATYLTGEGMSVLQASRYTSLMMLFSSAFTMMSGFISQKMGNRVYVYYMHIALILGSAVLLLNKGLNAPMMIVFVLLYALSAPINNAMSPTVNSQAFGNKDYPRILASMVPAGLLAGAINPILTSTVLQFGGSLKAVYVIFACINAAGLTLLASGLAASPYGKARLPSS